MGHLEYTESTERVDVLLGGRVLPGTDPAAAAAALAHSAGIDPEQARELITSGRARVMKEGLDAATGRRGLDRLTAMGIEARLRTAGTGDDPAPTPGQEAGADRLADYSGEAAGNPVALATPGEEAAEAFNPYAMPRAELQAPSRRDQGAFWRDSAIRAPASHGWHWFREACRLFSDRPVRWGLAILIAMGGNVALSMVCPPVLDNIFSTFLGTFFGGGAMIMAHKQSEGHPFGILDIFAGFRQTPLQLLFLCLLYFVYMAVLAGIAYLIIGHGVFMALIDALQGQASPELAHALPSIFIAMFAGIVLMLPLLLSFFFAPSLVAVAGMKAPVSLYRGFSAGMRNWRAFLVNGLICLLFFALLLVLMGLVIALGQFFSMTAAAVLAGLLALLLSPLIPIIFWIMLYTASRDLFYESP